MPPEIAFPTTSTSGCKPHVAVSPPRAGDQSVGLVDHQQGARVLGELAQTSMESLVGKDDPGVGDRRLGKNARDVLPCELPLQCVQIVVRHDPHVTSRVGKDTAALRRHRLVTEGRQQLVSMAVVLAVEHQYPVAARDNACQAQRLGVGQRRR